LDQWLQQCWGKREELVLIKTAPLDSMQDKLPEMPAELKERGFEEKGLKAMVLLQLQKQGQQLRDLGERRRLRELREHRRLLNAPRVMGLGAVATLAGVRAVPGAVAGGLPGELRDSRRLGGHEMLSRRDQEERWRVQQSQEQEQEKELRGRELRERELTELKKQVGGDLPAIREHILEQLIMQDTGLPQTLKIHKGQERKKLLEQELKRRRAGTTREQSRSSDLLDIALDIVFHQFTIFRPLVLFVEMLGYRLQKAELDPQHDMFYSSTQHIDQLKTLIPISVIGIIFGGIHLIPIWLSTSPSYYEKLVWKISAIWITTEPVVLVFLKLALDICKLEVLRITVITLFGVTGVMWIVARLAILVLVFTTLRKLPEEAFFNIQWSTFFPHV
jgi:hypothetical protein